MIASVQMTEVFFWFMVLAAAALLMWRGPRFTVKPPPSAEQLATRPPRPGGSGQKMMANMAPAGSCPHCGRPY